MFNTTFYKKKDGNVSSIKYRMGNMSFTYNPNGSLMGSSYKLGNLVVFNDASFNPVKYGIKTGSKTYYYNKNWNLLK